MNNHKIRSKLQQIVWDWERDRQPWEDSPKYMETRIQVFLDDLCQVLKIYLEEE